jgi:FlaA1/EpsC-like NDP-sugar epimerase
MSGLLLKDFLSVRKQGKTIAWVLAFYLLFFVALDRMGGPKSADSMLTVVISIVTMLAVVLTVNTFAYDEAAKWDVFARSLPVGARGIVGARYLLAVLYSAAGALLALAAALISGRGRIGPDALAACTASGAVPLILCSVLIPLFYKFGIQKARIAVMAVFLIPFVAVMLLKNFGVPVAVSDAQVTLLLKLSPVIVLAAVGISFFISCRIYRNREV